MRIEQESKRVIFTTKDMLLKQIQREGPRIARAFDSLARSDLTACSEVYGRVLGQLLRHLPQVDSEGYKETAARLLLNASSTIVASIEVARHGYPRQYGALARVLIETLATVVVIAIKPDALDEFHRDALPSSKCIGWAKPVLPPIGQYYGFLNSFVHTVKDNSSLEIPVPYRTGDEALEFVLTSLRGNFWILDVVTDLVFSDETPVPRFWQREGRAVWFAPSPEAQLWTDSFLQKIASDQAVP